jgi:hypothetical protein
VARRVRGWRAAGLGLLRGAVGPALEGEAAVEEIGRSAVAGVLRLRLSAAFPTGAATEALMMLPPGAGPHPAVLLFHDHGSAFAIGKEKAGRARDDPAAAAEAAAWQARLYDGVSLGEALVARRVRRPCLPMRSAGGRGRATATTGSRRWPRTSCSSG